MLFLQLVKERQPIHVLLTCTNIALHLKNLAKNVFFYNENPKFHILQVETTCLYFRIKFIPNRAHGQVCQVER